MSMIFDNSSGVGHISPLLPVLPQLQRQADQSKGTERGGLFGFYDAVNARNIAYEDFMRSEYSAQKAYERDVDLFNNTLAESAAGSSDFGSVKVLSELIVIVFVLLITFLLASLPILNIQFSVIVLLSIV